MLRVKGTLHKSNKMREKRVMISRRHKYNLIEAILASTHLVIRHCNNVLIHAFSITALQANVQEKSGRQASEDRHIQNNPAQFRIQLGQRVMPRSIFARGSHCFLMMRFLHVLASTLNLPVMLSLASFTSLRSCFIGEHNRTFYGKFVSVRSR
jgi:hypothetical protein